MKAILILLTILFLVGCNPQSGSGGGSEGGIQPQGCAEKLDVSSVARAAGSAFRVNQACALDESRLVESVPTN